MFRIVLTFVLIALIHYKISICTRRFWLSKSKSLSEICIEDIVTVLGFMRRGGDRNWSPLHRRGVWKQNLAVGRWLGLTGFLQFNIYYEGLARRQRLPVGRLLDLVGFDWINLLKKMLVVYVYLTCTKIHRKWCLRQQLWFVLF